MNDENDTDAMNYYYDTDEYSEIVQQERNKWHIRSSFSFLREHKGFRNGKLHMVLGDTSSGKSSLIRGLLSDILINTPPDFCAGIWLSEESTKDFWASIAESKAHRDNPDSLGKLTVASEISIAARGGAGMLDAYFHEFVSTPKIKLFVFDNITTSRLYTNLHPQAQFKFSSDLKAKCEKLQIPFLLVAHTNKSYDSKSFTFPYHLDIRGDKSIVNLIQYLYVVGVFMAANKKLRFLKIAKHRDYAIETEIFGLVFERNWRIVTATRPLSNSEFEYLAKEEKKRRDKK